MLVCRFRKDGENMTATKMHISEQVRVYETNNGIYVTNDDNLIITGKRAFETKLVPASLMSSDELYSVGASVRAIAIRPEDDVTQLLQEEMRTVKKVCIVPKERVAGIIHELKKEEEKYYAKCSDVMTKYNAQKKEIHVRAVTEMNALDTLAKKEIESIGQEPTLEVRLKELFS